MTQNYFSFYDIAPAFELDLKQLKRCFIEKSKSLHPDFFTLDSEEKQTDILELSAYNNEAYKTLRDPSRRYKYVLSLLGVSFVEGKEMVPQDFLMEMMEINEGVMELEMDPSPEKLERIKLKLDSLKEGLDNGKEKTIDALGQITAIDDKFITLNELNREANLLNIKEYVLKMKYLSRIEKNIDKFK